MKVLLVTLSTLFAMSSFACDQHEKEKTKTTTSTSTTQQTKN